MPDSDDQVDLVTPWTDVLPRISELPDRAGILLPSDAAVDAAQAMECFRRYARDVWQWPDAITNAGISGPHRYVNQPPVKQDPDEFMDTARSLVAQAMGIQSVIGLSNEERAEFDRRQREAAIQIARDLDNPGGWRHSIFDVPDGTPVEWFWRIETGFIG